MTNYETKAVFLLDSFVQHCTWCTRQWGIFHQSFQRDRIIHKGRYCLTAPRFTLHGNKPDQMLQAGKDLFQSADRFTRSIISYASKPLCHHTLTDTNLSQLGNSPHECSEMVAPETPGANWFCLLISTFCWCPMHSSVGWRFSVLCHLSGFITNSVSGCWDAPGVPNTKQEVYNIII